MKKHLIAAAVVAAVAAPAMAQNVTISGILDTGFSTAKSGATTTPQTVTSGTSGMLSTSGFRLTGSEDLGAGLKASFTILKEVKTNTGVDDTSSTFADQINISLSGGFGTVTAGKHGFPARNANGVGAAIGNVGLVGSVAGTSMRQLGDERDNSFTYMTPTISGLSAAVSYSPQTAARSSTTVGDTHNGTNSTQGYLLQYTAGPLTVAVSQLQGDMGLNAYQETTNIAANYDFGVAKVGFIAMRDTPDSSASSVKNSANVVNISVPMGATSLIGAFHDYSGKAASGVNPDATSYVVGVVQNLSKRTNVYAVYSKTSNNSTGRYGITGQTAPAADSDPTTIGVGVRHSF